MYTNTRFNITMEGHTSNWHRQETGIRQGCPLSPYLFLIIMTTLFYDIHEGDPQQLIPNRICGANFDEIVYADDTICVSTSEIAMNLFLKDIENEGKKYGLALNKNKCELLTTSLSANIQFGDGTQIKRKPEVTYLGCQINQYSNISQEIGKRIAKCMTILKRLDVFWKHCKLKTSFKITVFDAVIRAKLLYGIESAQLTPSHQRRIEVFQLKGLRKILDMKTTFVDRSNTNENVFKRANEIIESETREGKEAKKVKPFVNIYKNSRIKRLVRVRAMKDDHPVKCITFGPDPTGRIVPWDPPNRRVGRPRFKWVTETIKTVWENIRHTHPHISPHFDNDSPQQHEAITTSFEEVASIPQYLFK